MAAPSGIVWGATKGSYGRIGIHTSISNVDLKSTVTIQVWFWSKYGVTDSNNRYFFNNNASTATTEIGDVNIKHTVNSGDGWSTSNQTKLGTYTYTYTRTSSSKKIYCAAKLSGIDSVSDGATMLVSTYYTIPSLPVYTISFNANGGSGVPSSISKVHGTNITLPSTIPTRSGHSFLGWNSSQTATEASYSAGGSFTANLNTVLYAVWKADTFTIFFNANGGTGGPTSQTKMYGVNLTLSSSVPTKTNYNFVGWGTSSNATTAAYSAGGTYTANSAVTLYAVWVLAYTAPRISNLSVNRCDSNGTASDEGTYFKIGFSWATDKEITGIGVQWQMSSASSRASSSISASGTNGTVQSILGGGEISTEYTYDVTLTVSDAAGSSTISRVLPSLAYAIDFRAGGKGVSFGKPADVDNLFDVNFPAKFRHNVILDASVSAAEASFTTLRDKFGMKLTNGLTVYETAGIDPDTTLDHLILTQTNTPSGVFMYIKTEFYGTKSTTTSRMQTAFPYKIDMPPYYRYYFNGAWSDWMGLAPNAMTDAIHLYMSSGSTFATTAGTMMLVPFDRSRSSSFTNKLTFDSSKRGVVVGPGVNYVSVSGSVNARNGAVGGAYSVQPRRNSNAICTEYYYKANTGYESMLVPECIIDVTEGSVITLYFQSPFTSSNTNQQAGLARLMVKVVG